MVCHLVPFFSQQWKLVYFLHYGLLFRISVIRPSYPPFEAGKQKGSDCDIECRVTNDTEIYADSLIISKYDLTQSINNSIKYWDCDNYIYIAVENEG